MLNLLSLAFGLVAIVPVLFALLPFLGWAMSFRTVAMLFDVRGLNPLDICSIGVPRNGCLT